MLTVFCGKDFLICDQFLTKTHYKVDILRSSALRLLPPLVIPVVYSRQRKTKTNTSVPVNNTEDMSLRRLLHGELLLQLIIMQVFYSMFVVHSSRKRNNMRHNWHMRNHLAPFPHSGKTHTHSDVSHSDSDQNEEAVQ